MYRCLTVSSFAPMLFSPNSYFPSFFVSYQQVFAYTGSAANNNVLLSNATHPTYHTPVYGESCAVQTLTASNDDYQLAGIIDNIDGDSCYDVSVSKGRAVTTNIVFQGSISIPCTDYQVHDDEVRGGGGESNEAKRGRRRTAKLQFCSSYRTPGNDGSCDATGPVARDPDGCWCDSYDLGVEIILEGKEDETIETAGAAAATMAHGGVDGGNDSSPSSYSRRQQGLIWNAIDEGTVGKVRINRGRESCSFLPHKYMYLFEMQKITFFLSVNI